jgi:hypothetical protein
MGQPGQRFALPVLFLSAGQILLPCGIIAEEEHRRFREGLRQLWLGSINKIGKESLQAGFYQAKITAFFYLASQAKP